ncbi:hypothetical protein BH09PLA1_BH09PLA1_31230 [soil metagenome]
MIAAKSAVYLLVPNESNERVLRPASVLSCSGNDLVLTGLESATTPAIGANMSLFFEKNGRFFQQCGSIVAAHDPSAQDPSAQGSPGANPPRDAVTSSEATRSFVFRSVGEPVSAESRGSFRVAVVALHATARVDKERDCALVDVSAEGLGVLTRQKYRLGTAVKLLLDYENQHVEGLVRVQTVRAAADGTFRCGLLVPSTEPTMRRSLQKITTLVQRQQLQNLRRSA